MFRALGIEVTGRAALRGIDVMRFEGGVLRHKDVYYDGLTFARQVRLHRHWPLSGPWRSTGAPLWTTRRQVSMMHPRRTREASMSASEQRLVGNVGIVAVVLLLLGNILHPFDGTTEMYGDVQLFMEKMSTFWIIDHLVLAIVFLAVPWVAWTWAQRLDSERARNLGNVGWMLALVGTAIGVVHLAGIDGVALPAFRDVIEASGGAEAEIAAAGALLKVHLTTFMGWLIVFWVGAQAFLGAAAVADGRRRWLGWLMLAGAGLALASATIIALEGQLTTLSEPILFRTSTFAFTLWVLVGSLDLRAAGNTDEAADVSQRGGLAAQA